MGHPHGGLRRLGQPQRRPHLLRDGLHKVAIAALVDLQHLGQQGQALFAAGARVALEGAARGSHGLVHVGGRAHADAGDGLLVGGIDDVQAARADRIHPLSVDIELQMVLHEAISLVSSQKKRFAIRGRRCMARMHQRPGVVKCRLQGLGRMASAVPWMKALMDSTSSPDSLPVKSGMPRAMAGPLKTKLGRFSI
ncbi:hypothetical protein SDC9_186721 [bioreactor metagenome]|uniref:Uncharacterized protein n=1 Tax=bioreactor metagenome TaxID=1076179 RepID=A0A645HUZ6_9ZZZZ